MAFFDDLPDICSEARFKNVGVCASGSAPTTPTTAPTPTPTPEATATPEPDYGQLKADAYVEARDDLTSNMVVPQMRLWPANDTFQIVNLDTYLYVESGWSTITGNGEACDSWTPSACVTVSLTGEPEESQWSFVEDNSLNPPVQFTCERGERQPDDLDDEPVCGKTWTNSSDVTGNVTTEMTVKYDVTVATSHPGERNYLNASFDAFSPEPDEETLTVVEVLTYGYSDIAPVPQDSNDGLCSKWGISFVCWVGNKAKDAAIWALVNAVPGLEEVWNFFKGCGDGVLEALGGILEILTTIKDAVINPEEFFEEKLGEVEALFKAATDNFGLFVSTVLHDVAETDYRDEHGAEQWAGKMACQYALEILSGQAQAGVLIRLDKFFDAIPGNNRPNHDNDGDASNSDSENDNNNDTDSDGDDDAHADDDANEDDDNDPVVCQVSSFPTGTPVRMASGTLLAIEHIQPGDHVLAADPTTGQWSPQLVLNQWSYIDTDQMTTARLDDGSQIEATDHHLFWVESSHAWVELEHTQPGDYLLTPNGTIQVANVITHPQTETLVWELDTAGPDTFTVHTGTHDLLVHNNDKDCRVRGDEIHADFDSFNEARSDAIDNAGLGDDTVPFVQEKGPYAGEITGSMSPDGKRGWRIDWDAGKGFHVNWWDHTGGAKRVAWVYGSNAIVDGTNNDFLAILEHFPPS